MATTVALGSDLVVDEETGTTWFQVNRTGDTTGYTTAIIFEDWGNSTANIDDISFNQYSAGSIITYNSSTKSLFLSFAPGVKSIKIPYAISNDIVEEASEKLVLKLTGVSTGATIGKNSANIKINASDPVLSINGGLLVEEGNFSTSYIELSRPVNFDVTVKVSTYLGTYKQANYLGQGGDYNGLTDKLITISAGQTKVYVPFQTNQNADPTDWKYESTEIRIEATSVPNGVLLGKASDIVTILDKAIVPPVTLPTLSINGGLLVEEGNSSTSYAVLSKATDHDVTFKVSTYFGTYNQANYLGEAGDYNGLTDKLFTIPAGQTRVDIPVQILQNPDPDDWEYEAFEIRIEAGTVSGATLDVGSAIINIKDVATWTAPPVVTVTPLTASMLVDHKQAFLNLESEVGTSSAVEIIKNESFLLKIAKTLQSVGQLSLSFLEAGLSLTATTAFASQEELPRSELIDMVLARTSGNYPFSTAIQLLESFSPKQWTNLDVILTDGKYLRVNDSVDGRLVINQPWMALDANGKYITSNSLQGRFGGSDNLSHNEKTLLKNSFDWSGVSKYAVVPYDARVVNFNDNGNIGNFNNGLGNFVTLKLDVSGKDIYLTFAHLKQYSVSDIVKQAKIDGSIVPVGAIIGMTGQTGAAENSEYPQYAPYGYAVHLHMQAGTSLETTYGNSQYADADKDEIPPVYMLGFNSNNVATMNDLGSIDPTGNFTVQDYGFPIGDWDAGESYVASNILPTISVIDFLVANPTFNLPNINIVRGNAGDNHFTGEVGDNIYLGREGYDQVNYFGPASNRDNFTVTQNPDSTIKISSAEFGTDILSNVEGVWFDDQFKWFTIENLLNLTKTYFTTPSNPVLEGTSAKEIFIGDDAINWFIGNGGGDTYNGQGEYDQVEYYGPDAYRSNFIFSRNLDDSVTVSSPYGSEVYNDIEGVWFGTEYAWYSVDSLVLI